MASTFSPNVNLELQGAGDNVDTWGAPILNTNVFTRVDTALGATVEVPLTSSNVTLTLAQGISLCYKLTGVLSANVAVSLPLNSGATLAIGGFKVIDNQTTGNFTVTIKTIVGGSTGVIAPQGARCVVYSDATNVTYAAVNTDDRTILKQPTVAGSPSGALAGVAGSSLVPSSIVLDRTSFVPYVCTTTGDATTAVWFPISNAVPAPQGVLTLSSNATSPIITSDTTSTAVYWTPYQGAQVPIWNGSFMAIYRSGQLVLTLTAAQAANQIYDVFEFIPAGTTTPIIGTGPAWASATAGSSSRGTGAGTTQLSVLQGTLVNTVQITATNNGVTYPVEPNKGTCIGSISMDATNGQVTCHRTVGQSRKWGVSNAYACNRLPVTLLVTDPTANWTYTASSVWRSSNGNAANSVTIFQGLAEEMITSTFQEAYNVQSGSSTYGIGLNATNSPSGSFPSPENLNSGNAVSRAPATLISTPLLGINKINCLEWTAAQGIFSGTQALMQLAVSWRA